MPTDISLRLEDCNCFAVRSAARHITQLYDHYLAPLDLRTTQFSVLAKLKRKGALSINALASDMVMDRTTLGRNIQPLQRDGLIAVEASTSDRRTKLLRLTTAGEKRLHAAMKLWEQAQTQFESSFGGKRSAEMRALMRAVAAGSPSPPEQLSAH
jgi:DNA-binding MarR family transcriptional regulator